jgi:hypothetical protein
VKDAPPPPDKEIKTMLHVVFILSALVIFMSYDSAES